MATDDSPREHEDGEERPTDEFQTIPPTIVAAWRSVHGRDRNALRGGINNDRAYVDELSGDLIVVADGLGVVGGPAAEIAVEVLSEGWQKSRPKNVPDAKIWLVGAFLEAHVRILKLERSHRIRRETTLTVGIRLGWTEVFAHVGDSRGYIWSSGKLALVTEDHTLAQRLANQRLIDQEDVRQHWGRNQIEQVLGRRRAPPIVHLYDVPLKMGDIPLVCSDGVSDCIDLEREFAEAARLYPGDAASMCNYIINCVLAAGARDDATLSLSVALCN
jgi:protein phosphatase